jgi:hypothetical protein
MALHVDLTVKFRLFGITFGTLQKSWTEPVAPTVIPPLAKKYVDFHERGVDLVIAIAAAL